MMRQRSAIMPDNSLASLKTTGGDAQDVNMAIVVELMLDMRQIAAAQFVVANGGTIPTPVWLKNIAKGL